MKRFFQCTLLTLLAAGCGRISEKEPNDHFSQATPVRAGSRAQGTISKADDIDFYRFDSPEDGILSVHVGGIRDIDFVLSIQNKDRQELKRYDETGIGGDERALDIGVQKDTYYIVLSNKNPKADNPKQPYFMKIRLDSSLDRELEPNDSALQASPIRLGETLRGHYFPKQNLLAQEKDFIEDDWLKIKVEQSGLFQLNIDVSEVPGVDPILEIYDVNAYKIKEVDTGGVGEPESLRNFGIRGPVEYTLRLRSKTKAGSEEIEYGIVTELLPYEGKNEFEPNDQRVEATPFEKDAIEGTIAPAGDADWYKISGSTQDGRKILRAVLSPVAGMDLKLDVYDEVGTPLLSIDNMGKEQPEILAGLGLTGSDRYLVVSEKSGKASDNRKNYRLTRELVPAAAGLEFESNDSSATAQGIKVGESVDGYYAPKGDADWYEFNVYQKGIVNADIAGVINVRPALTLYDQESKEIASAAGKKPGEPLSMEKELEPGTYWLYLRPSESNQNNVRDKYTLRLRIR
ncbi:MAG: hypothetical protein WCU88_12130 [Elusimicrobiota bacterium]|jgi:hypothetical protein